MPRGNGMGPWNMGPGTGRGFGPCGAGRGYGYGAGFRRSPNFGAGYGRRFGAGFGPGYGVDYYGAGLPYSTEMSRKEFLEEQQKLLKSELAQIERELESEK